MSLEGLIVRVLNSQRRSPQRRRYGIHIGAAQDLVTGVGEQFVLRPGPVHSLVLGRTGSGKSTALLRVISEHLRLNVPFFFIDFHGSAIENVLAMLGDSSHERPVILIEPWSDSVTSWNPLQVAEGESSYGVVQELIAVFRQRLWPDAWGPRLEELLRITLLALAEARLTLLEAVSFISRPDFRRTVLRQVSIHEVREFWSIRFERLSPSQRTLVTETVLNKLSVFHDPANKYVLGELVGTLDFDRALREGQTILANFSSGRLRGNAYVLAALLVAAFKNAVYRRPEGAREYSTVLDDDSARRPSKVRLEFTDRDSRVLEFVYRFGLLARDQIKELANFGSVTRVNTRVSALVRSHVLMRKAMPIYPGSGSAQALYHLGGASTAVLNLDPATVRRQIRQVSRWDLRQVEHVRTAAQALIVLTSALRRDGAESIDFRTEPELRRNFLERKFVPDGWLEWTVAGKRYNCFVEVDLHHEGCRPGATKSLPTWATPSPVPTRRRSASGRSGFLC